MSTSNLPIADYSDPIGRPSGKELASPNFESSCAARSLTVAAVPFDRLTETDKTRWESIRQATDRYREPFFSVAFSDAVHQVRGDVEVAIVHKAGLPTAFLPFHRIGRHAYPVGRFFNDAHNLIRGHHDALDWRTLLTSLGLKTFEFHALAGSDPGSFPSHTCHETVRSFRCEIGDDPGSYLRQLQRCHKTIGRQGQKTRKMAREVGEIQ
ncbi:MAG: hypothetical protein AAFN70_08565, partial [Planctomycetota bacterium]